MSVLAASDLDRTLIWSAAALDLPGPDELAPSLVCVEVYLGAPLSFTTMRAHDHLAALGAIGALVPVTTRTVEQYRRVRLPGPPPAFAVCANGGRLLVDGVEDPDWTSGVGRLVAGAAPVVEVAEVIAELTGDDPGVLKRRVAQGLFCYLVLDPTADPAPVAQRVAAECAPRGWTVSVQGRKLYAVPDGLTKEAALAEVLARSAAAGVTGYVAAGDAHLDIGMLAAASAALVPRGSELGLEGWPMHAPHAGLTAASGVLAGEEIAQWLRDRAGPLRPDAEPSAMP